MTLSFHIMGHVQIIGRNNNVFRVTWWHAGEWLACSQRCIGRLHVEAKFSTLECLVIHVASFASQHCDGSSVASMHSELHCQSE